MKKVTIFIILLFTSIHSYSQWNLNGNTLGQNTWIGASDNYDMTFKTNSAAYAILNKNGNWSMGTGTAYNNVAFFLNAIRANGTGTKYAFYIDNDGSFSNPGLFCVKTQSEGGKVGIGVNDPQYKFHIKNGTNNVFTIDASVGLDGCGHFGMGTLPEQDSRLHIMGESNNTFKTIMLCQSTDNKYPFYVDCARNIGFNNITNFDSVSRGILSIGNTTTVQPTQRPNQVDIWVADYAAGDSRLYIRSESGTSIAIGKNTITGINNLAIGTSAPASSAAIDITSTTGALVISRMTTTQRNSLAPVNGMIIYNTTDSSFNFYENGSWVTK